MKARIYRDIQGVSSPLQVREAVEKEVAKQVGVIQHDTAEEAACQVMATVFAVLHKEFGFGKKRLEKLKNLTEDQFWLMRDGILGKQYTTDDCIEYIKKTTGIDLNTTQYEER